MNPVRRISGTPVPLLADDVDTDQIIPASFLKVVDRRGLREGLFHGWRFRADGTPDPDFILHHPRHEGANVLLVGDNFGCGSSREHAPWALQAWGFELILGRGFADIFRSNAHRNGLLTVALTATRHRDLVRQLGADPEGIVTADLEAEEVVFPDGSSDPFHIESFARHCMLHGVDPLAYLLEHLPEIEAHERGRSAGPARPDRRGPGEPGPGEGAR